MARKAKCRTISFKDEYMEAYDYIQSIPRSSEYVCELIMKDIKSKEEDVDYLTKQASELILKIEGLKQKNKNS